MSVKKLLAMLVLVVLADVAAAEPDDWEPFADGSLGRTTEFRGAAPQTWVDLWQSEFLGWLVRGFRAW